MNGSRWWKKDVDNSVGVSLIFHVSTIQLGMIGLMTSHII